MLELLGLTKRFGGRLALDGLTVTVPPGQVVGLLGPNGSGKTTAMRIVFGVIDADAGEVRSQGGPVGPAVRRRFGYMPEERGLYASMSVRDQLVYIARLAGVGRGLARPGRRAAGAARPPRPGRRAGGEAVAGEPAAGTAGGGARARARGLVSTSRSRGSTRSPSPGCRRSSRRPPAPGAWWSSRATSSIWWRARESVAVIDRGRLLLSGRVADLKASSGQRRLRVAVEGVRRWTPGKPAGPSQ